MTALSVTRWMAFVLLLLSVTTAGADEEVYWQYRYHGIDVTVLGSEQYAITLAHNMRRLDSAVVMVLHLDLGEWRPRTRVYALPPAEVGRVLGMHGPVGAHFSTNGFSNLVMVDNTGLEDVHYWDAYFGYAGSLLLSEGALRYPAWFRQGVSDVFAASVVSRDSVSIGAYSKWVMRELLSQPLIPMRKFLHLQGGDPQLKDIAYLYDAQCWFLAHLAVIEKTFSAQFASYFELLSRGQSEDDAFAASFKMSYEELDRGVAAALHSGKILTLAVKVADEPVKVRPRRLSAPEVKGRLALVAATNPSARDYGVKLASEALSVDPYDEYALRALAFAQIGREQYGEALVTVNKLARRDSLTAEGYGDSGEIIATVAGALRRKRVSSDDPTALEHRAFDDYQHAMSLDPENLTYWAACAELLGASRDAAGAKEFLPKIEQVFYQHPRNAALAKSIASMCAQVGDLDNAFKFAVAFRNNARTDGDRDSAAAYLSHLKADMERRDVSRPDAERPGAAAPANAPPSTPP